MLSDLLLELKETTRKFHATKAERDAEAQAKRDDVRVKQCLEDIPVICRKAAERGDCEALILELSEGHDWADEPVAQRVGIKLQAHGFETFTAFEEGSNEDEDGRFFIAVRW